MNDVITYQKLISILHKKNGGFVLMFLESQRFWCVSARGSVSPRRNRGRFMFGPLPSGKLTVCYWSHGHRNPWFTHNILWFIPVRKMLVYQRVTSRVEFQNNFRALSRMDMRRDESKSGNHKLNDFWMLKSRLFSFPMVQHVWTHKCWLPKSRHVFCLCPHLI